jgi:hypothetical protein
MSLHPSAHDLDVPGGFMADAQLNFVRQQGFENASAHTCGLQYSALMFQPRIVGLFVLVAVLLQSAPLFLALSAVLWVSVLLPGLNPFDALYNRLVATPSKRPPLMPAPRPRRFAQGMAATFMLLIGLALRAGWETAAWVLQALLILALAALTLGAFCLGSYVFHLVIGRADFARRTTPWARSG